MNMKNFFRWASFSMGVVTGITSCVLFHENLYSQGYFCTFMTVMFFFFATAFNKNKNKE